MTDPATTPPPRLVARTRRLDSSPDLLSIAGDDGIVFERGAEGLAARGVARRLTTTSLGAAAVVGPALAGIEIDDDVGLPGCGPVAFGAFPFRPGDTAELVVPELVVGRASDGTRWVTTIGPVDTGSTSGSTAGAPYKELLASNRGLSPLDLTPKGGEKETVAATTAPTATAAPTRFEISPDTNPADWCDAVAAAAKAIRAGRLTKVVLARHVTVTADQPLSPLPVLRRLRGAYPGCFLYAIDGFIGASPELLVSRTGDVIRAQPMAGTAARSGDPSTDQRLAAGLLASTKMREEHQITIDMVHDSLLPWCSYLDYEAEPSVVPMANVQHLATLVEGRLSQPAPSVLELVGALHPTPAVGGWPRDEALAVIAEQEGVGRGRYAGAVGWVDHRGQGTWAVSIRCAELDGNRARLSAGNGIVADSDPDEELAETQAKLQALLSAIVRP